MDATNEARAALGLPELPRHDCKFSPGVIDVLRQILHNDREPVEGPICDPFAGIGLMALVGRSDWYGIELEPEFAAGHDNIRVGDALDPRMYRPRPGVVVTSAVYPNRMTDRYLGPKCEPCGGHGGREVDHSYGGKWEECESCGGSGHDGQGRFGYTFSLNRLPSDGSLILKWGSEYRVMHQRWLFLMADILEPGPRRLIVNMSDCYVDHHRVYVVNWWIRAANEAGFHLVDMWPAETDRQGKGQNRNSRAEREVVMVFDLEGRAVASPRGDHPVQVYQSGMGHKVHLTQKCAPRLATRKMISIEEAHDVSTRTEGAVWCRRCASPPAVAQVLAVLSGQRNDAADD